jgi:hypothetical protein
MTILRKQLDAARREYQSIRYPGDLAVRFLSQPMRFRGPFLLGALTTGAIAAAAILSMMLTHPMLTPAASHSHSLMPLVKNFSLPTKMPFEMPSIPPLPGMPTHLSLRVMTPTLTPFEGLHLPSLDDIQIPLFSDNPGHA